MLGGPAVELFTRPLDPLNFPFETLNRDGNGVKHLGMFDNRLDHDWIVRLPHPHRGHGLTNGIMHGVVTNGRDT